MSTAPASEDVLQEKAESFLELIRDVVQSELQNNPSGGSVDLESLKDELRAELRRDAVASSDGGGNAVDSVVADAEAFFAAEPVKREINQMIQEAFQGVLPTMVKRFRSEVEAAMAENPSGEGSSSAESVVNSTEMKEMLEDRFRQMLLYLKTEVIPKAVNQS